MLASPRLFEDHQAFLEAETYDQLKFRRVRRTPDVPGLDRDVELGAFGSEAP